MMNTLMTGLGIGLAFWIVVIPSMLIIFRRSKSSIFDTANAQQERLLALMGERNEIDKEIKVCLWNICEALLRDKK